MEQAGNILREYGSTLPDIFATLIALSLRTKLSVNSESNFISVADLQVFWSRWLRPMP